MAIHALADLGKSGYKPDLKLQFFNQSPSFRLLFFLKVQKSFLPTELIHK